MIETLQKLIDRIEYGDITRDEVVSILNDIKFDLER